MLDPGPVQRERTVMTDDLPYRNPELPASQRIADLLGRMTLEEKVGQMMQLDARNGDLDDLIVAKHVGSILHTSPADLPRAVETVNTKTRLGIPLLIGDDCIHGYSFWPGATIFPSQLGMAASWDPAAVQAVGRATAEEVSATGVHWTFSPVLCIARDARWGRVDETFGEDPTLIGDMASAIIKGYQGGAKAGEPLAHDAILACAKHFAGYSETQGGRDASEADLSHRKLESWFLPPFERVAKEGCGTFMLGYESIDGVPVTFNKWLLSDKLRGDWHYQGTLITDWDNVGRMVWEQQVMPDHAHAAAAALDGVRRVRAGGGGRGRARAGGRARFSARSRGVGDDRRFVVLHGADPLAGTAGVRRQPRATDDRGDVPRGRGGLRRGGVGAGALGQLADQYGVEAVYQWCAWLPLLGVCAMWLPDVRHGRA